MWEFQILILTQKIVMYVKNKIVYKKQEQKNRRRKLIFKNRRKCIAVLNVFFSLKFAWKFKNYLCFFKILIYKDFSYVIRDLDIVIHKGKLVTRILQILQVILKELRICKKKTSQESNWCRSDHIWSQVTCIFFSLSIVAIYLLVWVLILPYNPPFVHSVLQICWFFVDPRTIYERQSPAKHLREVIKSNLIF